MAGVWNELPEEEGAFAQSKEGDGAQMQASGMSSARQLGQHVELGKPITVVNNARSCTFFLMIGGVRSVGADCTHP